MTDTIGAIIRDIHSSALRDNADPVEWVRDYLAEKNGRCSRGFAQDMIAIHVTQPRAETAVTP